MTNPSRQLIYGSVVFLGILLVAVFGYIVIDHSSFLDAFYMVVLTIFGVGYEEAVPVESPAAKIFTILVIISGCTTLLYILGAFIQVITEGQIHSALGARRMTKELSKLEGHVIICGFGRLGRMLARDLAEAGRSFVIVDRDPQRIDDALAFGYFAYAGDATDENSLKLAGVIRAGILATVLPNDAANVFITLSAVGLNPSIEIIARGEEPSTEQKLRQAGAKHVVLPAHIGAERMTHMILHPGAADFADSDTHVRHLNDELSQLGIHLEEIPVSEGSRLAGATVGEIEVNSEGSILIVGIRREIEVIRKPPSDAILEAGDRLIVIGHSNSAAELVRKQKPQTIHYRGAST